MAYTRDWSNAIPIDHSKFKDIPGTVRDLRVDLEDRLSEILYGFTAGETYTGYKKINLITIGTGSGDIPTGTGGAADINLEAKTIDSKVELITIDADGNEIQLTSKGNRLANDTWFKATNQAGTAGVNILKINTTNQIEIGTGFATHLVAPNTGPTTDLQYAPKGYVDKEIAAIVLPAFGDSVDKSASYGAQAAATDGIVEVFVSWSFNASGISYIAQGYTDANANPTTEKQKIAWLEDPSHVYAGEFWAASFAMSVKKGDYWKVVITNAFGTASLKVFWRPLET